MEARGAPDQLARGGGRPRQPPPPHPSAAALTQARHAPSRHAAPPASPTHPAGPSAARSLPPTGRPRARGPSPGSGPARRGPRAPSGPAASGARQEHRFRSSSGNSCSATAGRIGSRPDDTRQDPLASSNNKKPTPHCSPTYRDPGYSGGFLSKFYPISFVATSESDMLWEGIHAPREGCAHAVSTYRL